MLRLPALVLLIIAPLALGQEVPDPASPVVPPLPEDNGARVAVLGYHEFSATKEPTLMRMKPSEFKKQMEVLKELNLPVISLHQFLEWKRGNAEIPPRSVLITIDDGWKSVYTEAYPILKAHGYPFTIYLYKNYVDGGGRALTTPMIKEMQQNGCTIGSHSVSHALPAQGKAQAKKGPEAYHQFLRSEFGDSRKFLMDKFKEPVTTYAYPGGYFPSEMFPFGDDAGYECFFTVVPGKVRRDSSNHALPRYIVHGTTQRSFTSATSFQATGNSAPSIGFKTTPHPVYPGPGGMVESRLPTIWADLSGVENLDPSSISMRIAGFGRVPATFDPVAKRFSWTVNRRLRQQVTEITVQWSLLDEPKPEAPMSWSFLIDREAAYQAGAGQE